MTVDSTQPEDLRIDPRALFAALRARALRIGIVTLLLVVAAFVLLLFVPRMYESAASLLVEDRSNSFTEMPGATSPRLFLSKTCATRPDQARRPAGFQPPAPSKSSRQNITS